MEPDGLLSGDALCSFGRDLVVRSWNRAAERLLGLPAAEAVGRPCWEVLGGLADDGEVVCHPGCAAARLAREGRPVRGRRLHVRTRQGRVPVRVSTIAIDADRFVHVLVRESPRPVLALSPRRREVLELLAQGVPAKVIARRLGLRETTVRTHIRTLLRELGAHSQLEAVAQARRIGALV